MQTEFRGKKCVVLGLGISNLPLIDFLLDRGAIVCARDQKEIDVNNDRIKGFLDRGVNFKCGADYLQGIDGDFIFRSPGIRPDVPEIAAAVKNGAVLTSEMELFFELCPAKIFAITGSDGKTTTTTLTYKLLEKAAEEEGKDRRVYVGGNIGAPLLPLVDEMSADDYAVVELSSFQLMTMQKSAWGAAMTNITPNHLNWHTDMEEYTVSKYNVYSHGAKRVVLNADNDLTAALIGKTGAEEIAFSLTKNDTDICEDGGYITVKGERYLKVSDIKIPGRFNVANYMCAIGMTLGFVSKEQITEIAKTFGGVEHRNEFVREIGGVKYYNSSIDSSPSRTMAALSSYPTKPILICCGRDKHVPFDELACEILKRAKALVLSGEARDKIYAAMQKAGCDDFKIVIEPEFDKAVAAAKDIAEEGDIVLLSPACTSFDAFKNFEERGRKFKEIVNNF
ncbi:MAG: UDP-N-acetylmuramoyl-L-alanine--D-glutamate ligase [Clostridia bacterium]|nr:UDP-N-acetylmuramoyl-L-alanine--D-glutamate ligase [Clostridia bacterium]